MTDRYAFFILGILMSLLLSCAPPPPINANTHVFKTWESSSKEIIESWDTYKTERIKEGYTLLDEQASEVWVERRPYIVYDFYYARDKAQLGIRIVRRITRQINDQLQTTLLVNDDQGHPRVFQK